MNDSRKTKQALIEELKALREKVDSGKSGNPDPGGDDERSVGLTRREVLSAWVAPIILTVPLAPRTVLAKTGGGSQVGAVPTTIDFQLQTVSPGGDPTESPTNEPINRPTMSPTNEPTNEPTREPTLSPTNRPTMSPTNEPTNKPTMSPTNEPTRSPTAFPTVSPTSVIPVELIEFEIE